MSFLYASITGSGSSETSTSNRGTADMTVLYHPARRPAGAVGPPTSTRPAPSLARARSRSSTGFGTTGWSQTARTCTRSSTRPPALPDADRMARFAVTRTGPGTSDPDDGPATAVSQDVGDAPCPRRNVTSGVIRYPSVESSERNSRAMEVPLATTCGARARVARSRPALDRPGPHGRSAMGSARLRSPSA